MDNDTTFNYTYSAKEQEEIRRIREKYAPPDRQEDKMAQLRRLDKNVTKPGAIVSLAVGIVGTLLLGLGMSCVMVWTGWFLPGIVLGVVGIALIAAAWPLYKRITAKYREKLAPSILRLTDELMR